MVIDQICLGLRNHVKSQGKKMCCNCFRVALSKDFYDFYGKRFIGFFGGTWIVPLSLVVFCFHMDPEN